MSDPGDRYATPEMRRRLRPEPGNWQTCKCGAIGTLFPADGICSRCYFKREQPSPEFMLR